MSTVGDRDAHFTCQLKMEEQIFCAHTVKLTAPGLVIDKAGTVATELTYSFAAGQGLVSQDVGIVGHNPGDYYLFADITSPYYVSSNGLKIKKDKIGITIRDAAPDGWEGNQAGIAGNPLTISIVGNLLCRHTHTAGFPNRYFAVLPLGGSFNTDWSLKVVAPNGTVAYQSSYQVFMDQPGQWTVYPLEVPRQTQSGIGNNTWNATVTTLGGSLRFDYGDRVIQGSGIHYIGAYLIGLAGTGPGNPFSVDKDMLISYRLAGGKVPDTTTSAGIGVVNFVGSYSRSGLLGIVMSGYRVSATDSYVELTINTRVADTNTAFSGATLDAKCGGT